MNLSSGEKKALTIITAVAVLFVAVVGTSVFLLVRDSPRDKLPYLHVGVDGTLHDIGPVRWCDLYVRECDPPLNRDQKPTPHIPVPIGSTMVLSVANDIAKGPWTMNLVYSTPRGIVEDESTFESDSQFTVMRRSLPDKVLIGVTVLLPSGIINPDGTVDRARGVLTVDTKPADYVIPQI